MSDRTSPLVALNTLSLGQKALIVAFTFDAGQGERIQKMGLVPGEQVEMVRLASLEGRIEIKVRGYFISLGKEEAERIKVKAL